MKIIKLLFALLLFYAVPAGAQDEGQATAEPLKHYMPLYIDIPCELNVQKGFKEMDVAVGYANYEQFSGVRGLVEYDFAPAKGLGFEIELPFVFVNAKTSAPVIEAQGQQEEGGALQSQMALRIGFNYSFLVLPKVQATFSAGYFNELESAPFRQFGEPVFAANIYYPYFAAAKVWGRRFHTLVYAGPSIKHEFEADAVETQWKLNTTISNRMGYDDKENFVGVEINQSFARDRKMEMILRPQVQLAFSRKLSLGIVGALPAGTRSGLNAGGFLRLIYVPGT